MTLENAYYLSGIVVSIAAILGLRSLYLLKADILSRNIRASREKAIEASTVYLTETVTLSGHLSDALELKELPDYEATVGNFSYDSVSHEWYVKAGKKTIRHRRDATFSKFVRDDRLKLHLWSC